MATNFGMMEHINTETGEPYDYSSLFQQYDQLGQEALRGTYTSAIGKAEGKSRNTLADAYRMSREAPQGFGGIGSSLQEAFNRSFRTRREAGDLAMQQYQGGTFDLQSDFTGEFEDLLAQISGYGVGFDSSLIDEEWEMPLCSEGEVWNTATSTCVDAMNPDLVNCPDGTTAPTLSQCSGAPGGFVGDDTTIIDDDTIVDDDTGGEEEGWGEDPCDGFICPPQTLNAGECVSSINMCMT